LVAHAGLFACDGVRRAILLLFAADVTFRADCCCNRYRVCYVLVINNGAAQMTSNEKMIRAEELCGRYLADFNELNERGLGKTPKAQKLLEKGQFWRDRYNKLAGNS